MFRRDKLEPREHKDPVSASAELTEPSRGAGAVSCDADVLVEERGLMGEGVEGE